MANDTMVMALGWDKVYYKSGKGYKETGKNPSLFIKSYNIGEEVLNVYFLPSFAFICVSEEGEEPWTVEAVLEALTDGTIDADNAFNHETYEVYEVCYFDIENEAPVNLGIGTDTVGYEVPAEIINDIGSRFRVIFDTYMTVETIDG